MGLDTTHGAWHGAYSAFMRWRQEIAKAAGIPNLELMEGYFRPEHWLLDVVSWHPAHRATDEGWLPLRWEQVHVTPGLLILLSHSDCEGELTPDECTSVADELERLMPELAKAGDAGGHVGDVAQKTQTFIDGCRLAAANGETLEFH